MNQDFFINLTFTLHKVLELFPAEKQEKARIAELANKTLADLVLISEKNPVTSQQKREIVPRCLRKIELVQICLREAQDENWINPDNFLVLRKEYRKVERFLEDLDLQLQENVLPRSGESERGKGMKQQQETQKKQGLSDRQKKIMEILKQKEQAQVREFQKVLPDVTKRTLRRDLDDLLHSNLIERKGEWNMVFYKIRA